MLALLPRQSLAKLVRHPLLLMRVEYINPFVKATIKVFQTMLGCQLVRQGLKRKQGHQPYHEVSGIIELSGKAHGAVVLSLSREMAIRVTEVMLMERISSLNEMVLDAVGELANVIAGNAKAELEQLELFIGLPRMIIGHNHTLPLAYERSPIDIVFDSPWGTVVVEVGLVVTFDDGRPPRGRSQLLPA